MPSREQSEWWQGSKVGFGGGPGPAAPNCFTYAQFFGALFKRLECLTPHAFVQRDLSGAQDNAVLDFGQRRWLLEHLSLRAS